MLDLTTLTPEQRAELSSTISCYVSELMMKNLQPKSANERKIIEYASAVSAVSVMAYVQACEDIEKGNLKLQST